MEFIGKLLSKYLSHCQRKNSSKTLIIRQKIVIDSFEEDEEVSFPIEIESVRWIEETVVKHEDSLGSEYSGVRMIEETGVRLEDCLGSGDSGSDGDFSSTEDSSCIRSSAVTKIRRKRKTQKKVKPDEEYLLFSMDCL